MADNEQLYTALRNADAAGDTQAATKLASYIKSLPSAAPEPKSLQRQAFEGIKQHIVEPATKFLTTPHPYQKGTPEQEHKKFMGNAQEATEMAPYAIGTGVSAKVGPLMQKGLQSVGAIPEKIGSGYSILKGTKLKGAEETARTAVKDVAENLSKSKAAESQAAQSSLNQAGGWVPQAEQNVAKQTQIPSQSMHELGSDIQRRATENAKWIEMTNKGEINRLQNEIENKSATRFSKGDTLSRTKSFGGAVKQSEDFLNKVVSPANHTLKDSVSKAIERITSSTSFNTADSEIKALKAIGDSKEGTGYGVQINKLAEAFQKSLQDYSPEYKELIKKYPELKGESEAFPNQFLKGAAADVPKLAFKNPTNYQEFIKSVGGDEKYAHEVAGKYFGNEVRGMTSKQATDFIEKNSDVLDTIGGDAKTTLTNYANGMKHIEDAGAAYSEAEKSLTKTINETGKLSQNIKMDLEKLQRYSGSADIKGIIDSYADKGLIDKKTADELATKYNALKEAEKAHKSAVKAVEYATLGAASSVGGYWFWKTFTASSGMH